MLLVINAKHREEKHVSWFTKNRGATISLHEVVERRYTHPDAPQADIVVTEVLFIGEAGVGSERAATWVLLDACQNAVTAANKEGG